MAINPLQQPINYAVDVQSPFQAALGGLQLGAGLEELNIARQKRAMEAQQLQAAQAQQAQFQSGLNSFFAKPPEQRTYVELQPMLVGANKQQFDALKLVGEQMGAEKLNSSKKFTSQVLLAFEANPETAKTLLRERIEAEPDPGQKRAFQDILSIADQDPSRASRLVESLGAVTFGSEWYKGIEDYRKARREDAESVPKLMEAQAKAQEAVQKAANAVLTAEDDIAKAKAQRLFEEAKAAKEQIDARYAEGAAQDAIKKRAADLGLTKAQTDSALAQTKKLGIETKQAVLQLKALESGVGDPKEKFAQEEKIRKEWQGRSKVYGELQGTFNTLKASADSQNGPGDIALITGFMKMLDPGSVVRETEFATARDTAGLYTRLENSLKKAENGQFLNDKQRSEYVALSKKYLDSAQAKAAQERKELGILVTNYKLNPQNVFGAETAPPQPQPTTEQRRQQAISQIPTGAAPAPAQAAASANIRLQAEAILRGGQ